MPANTKPTVSVIVPVYNAADFLPRAVESLLQQDCPGMEILLVDDGSLDGSGPLCDRFAQGHPCIRVFHTENKGQSHARNFGVRQAKADWIAFMDADDVYIPRAIGQLAAIQRREQSDAVFACLEWVSSQKKWERLPPEQAWQWGPGDLTTTEDTASVLERLYYKDYSGVSPVAKLYRKAVLLAHPFPEGRIQEDMDTTYRLVAASPKITLVNRRIYFYIHRPGSTTSAYHPGMEYLFEALDHNAAFVWQNYPNKLALQQALAQLYIINGMHLALYMLQKGLYRQAEPYRRKMKGFGRLFWQNPKVSWKQKAWFALYMASPRLFLLGRAVKKLPNA